MGVNVKRNEGSVKRKERMVTTVARLLLSSLLTLQLGTNNKCHIGNLIIA